jgi:hypothetical protein
VNSIAVSDSDYIFATNYDGISISTDYGQTWIYQNTFFYTLRDYIAIDSVGNIFLGHTDPSQNRGVYKSQDSGNSWSYMGGAYPHIIHLYEKKIFFAGPEGLYLYDPEYIPYIGINYLPLNVGNRWQFLKKSIYGQIFYYGISEITINKDTIINNTPYYLWDQNYIRYSDSTKMLYTYSNDSDRVIMDFKLIPGTHFLQYTNGSYRTVTVTESNESRFGFPYNVKGYSYSLYPIYDSRKFAENIGFYSYFYFLDTGLDSGVDENLISCLLYDSSGNQNYISEHYKPIFTISPLISIDTTKFELTFMVNHHYSRFLPPGTALGSLNFTDSVFMYRYYSNGDSIINLPILIPDRDPQYITPYYSVNFLIDTTLMKNGFDFYYKFCAKDKALIPEYAYAPDIGYFKCVWDFPNSVLEEEKVANYSLEQNFPNPFNPITKISYTLAKSGFVEIDVFDMLGRKVKTSVNEFQTYGNHQSIFDASELSSGIYFYQIKSGNFIQTKKMILLK